MINSSKFYYDQMLFDQKSQIRELVYNTTKLDEIKETAAADEKVALAIIKYALEYYLGWTPAYSMEHLNADVIKKLRLNTVCARIRYPFELSSEDSPRAYYIVCKLYPDLYKYKMEDALVTYYRKNILELGKYTHNIFDPESEDGKKRAGICLLYAISEETWLHAYDTKTLYAFFAGENTNAPITLKEFLIRYHFNAIVEKGFAGNVVDFLHASLPQHEKSPLWYARYNFIKKKSIK